MYKAAIFDLDGTLVTMEMDFASLRKQLEKIYYSYGYPPEKIQWTRATIDSIKRFRAEMNESGFDGDGALGTVKSAIYEYELQQAPLATPIPGAKALLEYLKEKGYKIAVVTRNNRDAATCSMNNTGLRQYVDLLVAREDVKTMKPDPEQFELVLSRFGVTADETVVIGDYRFEIDAGKALGCHTIGVLTGTGSREDLADADIIVPSVADLHELLV